MQLSHHAATHAVGWAPSTRACSYQAAVFGGLASMVVTAVSKVLLRYSAMAVNMLPLDDHMVSMHRRHLSEGRKDVYDFVLEQTREQVDGAMRDMARALPDHLAQILRAMPPAAHPSVAQQMGHAAATIGMCLCERCSTVCLGV